MDLETLSPHQFISNLHKENSLGTDPNEHQLISLKHGVNIPNKSAKPFGGYALFMRNKPQDGY